MNLLEKAARLRRQIDWNANYFKALIKKEGFGFIEGDFAIIPIMLYEVKIALMTANELLKTRK